MFRPLLPPFTGETGSASDVTRDYRHGKYKDLESFMLPLEGLNSRERAILSQSSCEYVDEVVERGSPKACLSTLLVAIIVMSTLWFGHFASMRAKPAWAAIEYEAIALRRELGVSDAHANPGRTASH